MIKLPPLSKHDHPEPQTMVWSELEMKAIQSYAKQAVRDAYEEAAKACDAYAELCEREQGQTTLYGHIRASASQVLANEIRALIKEVV